MTLTCPEESNIAAIAKQMHATAVQAENEFFAAEQLMRAAVNRPTVVLTTIAPDDFPPSTLNNIGDLLGWVTLYDNTAGDGDPSLTGGFGPNDSGDFTRSLGAGLYEVGMFVRLTAVGVVTDNSFRQLLIQHNHPDPLAMTGEVEVQTSGILLFETNTGVGVETGFIGHFNVVEGDRFDFLLSHNNGSNLDVNSGAYIWASKISDSTLTRVL